MPAIHVFPEAGRLIAFAHSSDLEAKMRLAVRGWGRDQGETVIAEADLLEAGHSKTSRYKPGKVYLRV